MEKSKKSRESRLVRKSKSANGSLSTARIYHDMMNAPLQAQTQQSVEDVDSAEIIEEPLYIKLYKRTKRSKGDWDAKSEANYQSLKELHKKEIDGNGEDNLTVKEAYARVLKTKSGYVRGLGYGARVPKYTKASEENRELRARVEILQQQKESLSNQVVDLTAKVQEQDKKIEEIEGQQLHREQKLKEEMVAMIRNEERNFEYVNEETASNEVFSRKSDD